MAININTQVLYCTKVLSLMGEAEEFFILDDSGASEIYEHTFGRFINLEIQLYKLTNGEINTRRP